MCNTQRGWPVAENRHRVQLHRDEPRSAQPGQVPRVERLPPIAPDLYDWGSRLGCLRTIMRDIGAKQGRTFHDIDAARRWLVDRDECTGIIGVVGFCMGASYAVLLAPDHGYAAASVNLREPAQRRARLPRERLPDGCQLRC